MSVYELLARLEQIDARVVADGDRLRLDAPEGAITPALREEIRQHKSRLLEVLGGNDGPPIVRRGGDGPAPASSGQHRLWFVSQLLPDNPMYNIPLALRLRGVADSNALAAALTEIVRRHESLRTTFRDEQGKTLQIAGAARPVPLPLDDLRNLPEAQREAWAREIAATEIRKPFDLKADLLLRARFVRMRDDDALLLITIHHIAADGWSMGVLMNELTALYEAFAAKLPSPLAELPLQYADLAAWQNERLSSERMEGSLAYWREHLTGVEVLELPGDRPRPASMTYSGGRESLELEPSLTRDIRALSREEGTTLFMTLLAAYEVLIHRYSGRTDFAVGSPTAGRNRAEVEGLIGFFVNNLVLRADLSGDPSFARLLARVRQTVLDGFAHHEVPFDRLVDVLQPQRDLRHNPLFQILFALHHGETAERRAGDLRICTEDVDAGTAKFDLGMEVEERDGALFVHLSYSSDLFEAATVRRMLGHFATLLRSIVRDRGIAVSRLAMLSAAERAAIVDGFNDTDSEYERDATIAHLFEQQAGRSPEAIAATDGRISITYGELNDRAEELAGSLRARGASAEVRVGVRMERSIDLLVAVVAIAKCGAAYVPIDPSWPEERQQLIARDLDLDDTRRVASAGRASALNTAYVIYTSGSTGIPKGVAVPQRAVLRLVRNNDFARFGASDVVLQYAPLAFDASTLEVWGTLLNGATLVVMPQHASLEELGAAIVTHGVTALWLTAGLFHLMVEQRLADFAGVRHLLAGGDVLSPVHVRKVLEAPAGLRLINGYGPTENTTFTCCHVMTAADAESVGSGVPIGRPIRNTRVYILDGNLEPVPPGVAGELYAAGDGLARGYAGDAALTAEKFVPSPFAAGERLYRTGDLARWRADGVVEFLGRIDHQIKIRGYRVEPGEIESVLRRVAGVRDALVVVREEARDDKRLVAYVAGDALPSSADLRATLKQSLPDFMVPSAFVALAAFPLTANGKIDRARLPAPERERRDPLRVATPLSSDTERVVATIWEELLGITGIGVHDNFFDAGGHSLLLLQMRTRLAEHFRRDVPLMEMFRKPTIRAMADFIDAKTAPVAAGRVVNEHQLRAQLHRTSMNKRKQQQQERRDLNR